MKKRLSWYVILAILVILDSLLLSSPNLLGKIGLIIYKYHYLRTFPRTLLTVSTVILVASVIVELIRFLITQSILRRMTGIIILVVLNLTSIGILVKTFIDFKAWSYSHTGWRFQYGAYLLPIILIAVFLSGLLTLPKADSNAEISTDTGDASSIKNNEKI